VLLASLVAIALLVVAVPAQQRRDGIDAVNAAAQRAVGGHPTKKKTTSAAAPKSAKGKGTAATGKAAENDPAPTASASPTSSAASATAALRTLGHGPGHSIRTTGSQAVALTFDDGPDPVQTPKILALLAQYHLTATFCLIGQNVQKHPEIVREIAAAGHTLCNHTWNHSLTIGKDKPEQIQADLARTSAAIRAAVPGAKIPFFRAPGGNFTDRLVSVAAGDGMASLYWEVDPQDWNHLTGETDPAHVTRVIDDVRKHVKPGSIILSHDFNQPDTIEAYTKLLPWLTQNFQIGLPGAPASAPATSPSPSAPAETPSSPPATSTPPSSAPTTTPPAAG
jgi:peptidoglycan/xylan/chitin deacetylase (PgdA/CDA1 family)